MKLGQTAYVGIGVAAEYRVSGKTRAEFCRERGMAVTRLDYYLRGDGAKGRQKLVPVRVEEEEKERGSGFTLALVNGRRIELAVDFDEIGLSRLVAVLERS